MHTFPIAFSSCGQTLRALGYGPDSGVAGGVRAILIQGYSSSKHAMDLIATSLAEAGHPVVSLDLPGHKLGSSGGALISFNMVVQAALDANYKLPSPCRPVYIGHSMGAAGALVAASQDQYALGAVSLGLGYPVTVKRSDSQVIHYYLERWGWVDGASPLEVGLAMDKAIPSALEQLAGRHFMLISGTLDRELPPFSAQTLFDMAKDPKVHEEIETDHDGIPRQSAELVVQWINRITKP